MSDPVLEALTRLESGYGEMVPEHHEDVRVVALEIGELRIFAGAVRLNRKRWAMRAIRFAGLILMYLLGFAIARMT